MRHSGSADPRSDRCCHHVRGSLSPAGVVRVGEPDDQLLDVGGPLRRHDAEFGHVAAQRVDRGRTLADQLIAHPM
jgi:hypothetical protein